MLRESPTLVSAGQTTVGTDGFLIGSFFDIFTELSLDGGATWGPAAQNGDPSHPVDFNLAPEPATMLLVGGALMLASLKLRKR